MTPATLDLAERYLAILQTIEYAHATDSEHEVPLLLAGVDPTTLRQVRDELTAELKASREPIGYLRSDTPISYHEIPPSSSPSGRSSGASPSAPGPEAGQSLLAREPSAKADGSSPSDDDRAGVSWEAPSRVERLGGRCV